VTSQGLPVCPVIFVDIGCFSNPQLGKLRPLEKEWFWHARGFLTSLNSTPPTGVDTPLELGDIPPQGPANLEPPVPSESTEEGAETERYLNGVLGGPGQGRDVLSGLGGYVWVAAAICTCLSPAMSSLPAPPSYSSFLLVLSPFFFLLPPFFLPSFFLVH
jgi:hypothetical protein